MFLKSIEIRGFKSFADKTELKFTKGITAIVGPNGSGKSNISDAVRWVLGEQNIRNLRGGKMEDVIFSGTQFRKPLGLCQVSLTLDNEDKSLPLEYSDVTILRRLYRSGESEYYINNTKCRLKDIRELFMDTGIGKEGYSIIGQGKIDAILSGRPEDRRSIIEEAAGIVKFKWRKEEAEKRLKKTQENLTRIEDILTTYKERLEPLKLEEEKANKFLKLSKGLKEKEINFIVNSIDSIQLKIDNLNAKINDHKIHVKNLNSKYRSFKSLIDSYNKEINDIRERKKRYEEEYYNNKSKIQSLKSDIGILKEKIFNSEKNIKKIIEEYEITEKKIYSIKTQKNILEDEIFKLEESKNKIASEMNEKDRRLSEFIKNVYEKDTLLKKLKNNQIEYLSLISNTKNSINSIEENIKKIESKCEYIKNLCVGYKNSIKINSKTRNEFKIKINSIEEEIKKYNSIIDKNKNIIAKFRRRLKECSVKIKELNREYMKLTTNRNMLIKLDKQNEGYNRTSKILMDNIKSGKINVESNSCFLMGEIIKTDKKFETAVEVALGGAISNIITKNDNIAKKLIEHLKSNNLGRATFLPLNIIRGRKLSIKKELINIDGYIGVASDIVDYDVLFKSAVENVLGRTIVSTDMDSAIKIAKSFNYTVRVVTLSGEIVNPGGALTGGSLKFKSSNIIGRKREIKELEIKIKTLKNSLDEANRDLNDYENNIHKLDESNLNLKDKIYSKNIDITKLKEKLSNIDSENIKLNKSIDVSKDEMKNIYSEIKNLKLSLEDKKKELEKLNFKQKVNNNKIVKFEEELSKKNYNIDDLRNKLTDIKVKKAQIEENLLSRHDLIEKLKVDMKEMCFKIEKLKHEKEELIHDKDSFNKKIEFNKSQINKISIKIKECQDKINKLNSKYIKVREKVESISDNLESLTASINEKEEKIHNLQITLTRFSTEKENLNSKLYSDFEITYEDALKYKSNIEDAEKFKKEIYSLKKKISDIGSVNLGAIEEYRNTKEKVDFMNSQREDLIKGGKELENVIFQMTKKIKVLFKENFNKLRKNFNETFRELFKGGSADIVLTNGDELTGNIEITVEPPGKKLQNINLMSGGEKGLSAIALLFSVLKMKPTPFCILDEIEAALDDVNVLKYAQFLKKFSVNTQFIVITHRKGTMESSDVMYGITMEEKGISKIVSVNLDEKIS
jgi:chromosome segregation protein